MSTESKINVSDTMERKSSAEASILSIICSALKKASVVGVVYLAGYMQWSVAWFIGPVVLFVMRDQWKKSSDRRRATAKLTAVSSEKEVVLARLNDLPAWVFFPDIERAEWLNRIIKQVWPNVNQFARELVRDSIQPILRESLEKYKLNGFKFERIILGTVPFRIGGVKVYDKNIDRNEIVMDLDIFYAGDCDVSFHLSGLKGGIRDFQLHGMLRVVMKPLISSMPLVGGIQVFFLNNPDIDFDLVGIADVLDMPGLSDILRRIVIETVASMMVLPNKFPIKLSEEIEAAELKAPEPESSLRQATGPRLIQTENQLQTGFIMYVPHQCSPGYDGCIHAGSYCPSSFAEMNTAIDHRIHLGDRLESTPGGHFEYEMMYESVEGVLRVHVFEARHLMKKDVSILGKGKSDPYAVVTVGAQEFKTKVIDNSVDPKWDYWCEFQILESNGQQLYIHLWDKDDTGDDENLGRATIEVSNIVKKGSDDVWVTLEQAKHGMVHLRLTWLALSKNYSDLDTILNETQLLRASNLNTSLLTVFLDSCRNLPQARMSTKPDPYAVLRVGNHSKQTKVLMRTIHPVWEEGFTFLLPNPENDTLFLSIMDQKTSTEIGHFNFKIKTLCTKTNLEIHKEPFSLLRAGPESKVIWSMHLRILKRNVEEEMVGDDPRVLERKDSNISKSSLVSNSHETTGLIAEQPMQTESVEHVPVEELIEDSSISTVSNVPVVENSDILYHRTPSVTSSAGEAGLGRIQMTLRYSVQRQRLIVVVHKIMNIPLKDPTNIPDPYVKLYLLPERARDTKRKTQVIRDNCNPIFDETFEYVLNQGEIGTKQLEVTVGTQKQLFYSSSNILGQVIIDLGKLNLTQPYNTWFDLQPESE